MNQENNYQRFFCLKKLKTKKIKSAYVDIKEPLKQDKKDKKDKKKRFWDKSGNTLENG